MLQTGLIEFMGTLGILLSDKLTHLIIMKLKKCNDHFIINPVTRQYILDCSSRNLVAAINQFLFGFVDKGSK